MSINLNKETKKISGKYIYIDDAKKDYIQDISLESDIYQEVIEEEKGTTLEGESVVISDGDINKEVKAIVNGNSYQETTEGYNKFKFTESETSTQNQITSEYKENTIKLNGTSGYSGQLVAGLGNRKSIGKFKAGTYTTFVTELSGSVSFGVTNTDFAYYIYDSIDGTHIAGLNYNGLTIKKTFTLTEEKELYVGGFINQEKAVFNNYKLGFVIHEGTEEKPYEPYTNGASPNTEYKQDIEVVEGVNRFPLSINLPQKTRCTVSLEEDNFIFKATGTDMYFGNVIATGGDYTTLMGELVDVSSKERVYLKLTNERITKNIICFFDENKISLGFFEIKSHQGSQKIPQNAKYCTFRIGKGDSVDGETYSTKIMVSFDDLPYLPYGHIGLVHRGKNYFKPKADFTQNGVTFTNLENGYFKVEGKPTETFSLTFSEGIRVKGNINFCLEVLEGSASSGVWFWNRTDSTSLLTLGGIDKIKTVALNGLKEIASAITCTKDTAIYFIGRLQVEEGSTATEFEPYIEPIVKEINLNGNSIAKVGDIKDILNIGVDGSVSIDKKIFKVPFSDLMVSLVKNMNETVTRIVAYTNTEHIEKTNLLSNYFRYLNDRWNDNPVTPNIIYGWENTLSYGIHISTDLGITTLEKAKTFLDSLENGYLYARLLNPQIIELPSTEPIELFEGTNIFELVTNLGTTMAVTYNYITPSPSINRPSEIKTPVGKQSFYAGNKNFINFKKWYENKNILISNSSSITLNEITENSITFTPKSDDAFTNTYAMSSTNINENKAKYETWSGISLKENTKYTVSYEKNVSAIRFMLFFLDKDFNYLGLIDNIGNGQVITTPSKTKYITYRVGAVNSKDVSITVKNIQLEENTVATDYIEHQSQVQDLDVNKELLGPIVDKEDGSYFENKWVKVILDGETNKFSSRSSSTENNAYNTKQVAELIKKSTSHSNNKFGALCNYFKEENINEMINKDIQGFGLRMDYRGFSFIFGSSSEYNTLELANQFLVDRKTEGNPVYVIAPLETLTYTKLTDEQQAQWNKIKKMHTYEGVTNIYTINDNGISPVINLEYTTKYAEEYDFYIDENARFIVPEYGINYQVSIPESDLSDMPEASESAVKIAGKDGDVVLNTTYEPKDFNIVAYTDDNLEPKDKEAEKTKLVNFLHSIKNRTKNFGLLYREKFYPVKYNDKLTPTIYPKSIRFEIPIKSSKSLGYALEKKMIFGNGKEISNTIEETGCKIIIDGPIYGTNDSPMVITLNNYQMAYYNTVLVGNRLEIDTNNSTIKHISSNGEVTNVAAYYNHEYPKIKYGENEIKILSKIDSETQVYTEWYDLKI